MDQFLARLSTQLQSGTVPSADCQVAEEPKNRFLSRPGGVLTVIDEITYTALLGAIAPTLWSALDPLQRVVDFSYVLSDHTRTRWIEPYFENWGRFQQESEQFLANATHVVFADLAAFYENIDLNRLAADLTGIDAPEAARTMLGSCLNRWAGQRGKGIPQGYSASDLLAKLYLLPIDEAMRNAGYRYFRYVDDMRVFCTSEHEARITVEELERRVRERGLNLQSGKLKVLTVSEARAEIDGVRAIIETLLTRLEEPAAVERSYSFGPYGEEPVDQQDEVTDEERDEDTSVDSGAADPPTRVLEVAFEEQVENPEAEFNKTLFHFLIGRLRRASSDCAIDYCLNMLRFRPQETSYVLRYFGAFVGTAHQARVVSHLVDLLGEDGTCGQYQKYLILRFLHEHQVAREEHLTEVRACLRSAETKAWTRQYAAAILRDQGNRGDQQVIRSLSESECTETDRAVYMAALARLPVSERNSLYGRVRRDGLVIDAVIRDLLNQRHQDG